MSTSEHRVQTGDRAGDLAAVQPAAGNGSDAPPLSVGQQSILFDQQMRPQDMMYNLGRTFHVAGGIDANSFEAALRRTTARHEPLSWNYDRPRRLLSSVEAVRFETGTAPIHGSDLDSIIAGLQRTPIDLIAGELLRCRVQPLTDGTTVVVFVAHQVTADHHSLDQLWHQVVAELDGSAAVDSSAAQPAVGYAAVSEWNESDAGSDAAFWLDHPSIERPNSLCLAPPSGETDGFLRMPAAVTSAELRAADATAEATSTAAVAAALAPYCEHRAVELAYVAPTRTHPDADAVVGYLLNPLPLVIDCDPEVTLSSLALATGDSLGLALAHRTYPLQRILTDRREADRSVPSTRVLVTVDEIATTELDGSPVRHQSVFSGSAVADLSFFVEIRDDTVELGVEYSGAVVSRSVATHMLQRVDQMLVAATGSAQLSLGAIDTARSGPLVGADVDTETLVVHQLADRIEAADDTPASVVGSSSLSWSTIAERAAVIAEELDRRGVGPGDPVIVSLPTSPNLIACVVAVHLHGACYVPIDPSYPTERIALLAETAKASIALVSDDSNPPPTVNEPIVVTDDRFAGGAWPATAPAIGPLIERARSIDPEQSAYLIFTSGSTGTPRGVLVNHASLAASTNARRQVYPDAPGRFLVLSSIGFDSSIVGIFWTLATGGTIELPPAATAHDVDGLVSLLESPAVTHTLCVPTLYRALLARRTAAHAPWPQQVIVAGEACPESLVDEHHRSVPKSRLTNEYGPTEATVWATAHHCQVGAGRVPIGSPIPGAWVAVVDEAGVARPPGAIGELIIGGRGVAVGYLDDDAATAAKFSTDVAFGDVESGLVRDTPRFFRTGDKAAVIDGVVHFFGRADDQLNVGGARVEPGEVEEVIAAVDGVTAAVVVAVYSGTLDELMAAAPSQTVESALAQAATAADPATALLDALRKAVGASAELVAHYESDTAVSHASIRQALSENLPPLARPSVIVGHDALPRTPNGKIDRDAAARLPTEGAEPEPVPETADHGDVEAALIDLFRRSTRSADLGATDSFFDHGGHSLMVLDLVLAIEDRLGISVSTSAVYEAPSPRRLAMVLAPQVSAAAADPLGSPNKNQHRSLVIPIQPAGTKTPMFAIHNLGDDCEHFRPLSARLGDDQPMYGIGVPTRIDRYRGFPLNPDASWEVTDIATTYVNDIVELAPEGPVVILGACGGAVVGFEIVNQLLALGREVELFAMFHDLHAPHLYFHRDVDAADRVLWRWGHLKNRRFSYVKNAILTSRLKLLRRAEIAALRAFQKAGRPLPKRLQIRQYIERGLTALYGFEYSTYSGRTVAIRGSEEHRFPGEGEEQGWTGVIDDIEIVYVPGAALGIMQEPDVARVADVLTQHLA